MIYWGVEIREFQEKIRKTYFSKDKKRGREKTFIWFTEEVGELARALRRGDKEDQRREFGDVFAWLTSLANLYQIDLEDAVEKYSYGCPRCGKSPCRCEEGFLE